MGRRIVRVPPGFEHPKDADGAFRPGAHLELLYHLPSGSRSSFQIYEDVSEGTPVSPIFPNAQDLEHWLLAQGYSASAVRRFLEIGHAPVLVIESNGAVVDGIEGMKRAEDDSKST